MTYSQDYSSLITRLLDYRRLIVGTYIINALHSNNILQ